MKIRITHSSYIINFLDCDFDSSKISHELHEEFNKRIEACSLHKHADWLVQFRATYDIGDKIEIYTRWPSDKESKEKLVTVFIPIPARGEISWGVEPHQFVRRKSGGSTKNILVDVDYQQFQDRSEYIKHAIRQAVRTAFSVGFTLNGEKVKCILL